MKKFIAGAVIGAAVVGGAWALVHFTGTDSTAGATMVSVGDVNISSTEFYKELEKNPDSKNVLRRLIDNQVILNQSKAQNVEVTDKEVEDELASFTKERFEGDNKKLEEALKSYNVTKDELKQDIKITLIARKMAAQGVTITDQEKKDYFEKNKETLGTPEQVRAKHILVKEEAQANDILAKVKANPADFEKLAKEFSQDPSNKDKGGDLDFFGKGAMVPEFEKAAFGAQKGEIVGPVKTDFGYHIIQVTDKKEAVIPKYEDVEAKINKTLLEQKSKPLEELYTELRTKEKINIKDEKYKDILNPEPAAAPTPAPADGTQAPATTPAQ